MRIHRYLAADNGRPDDRVLEELVKRMILCLAIIQDKEEPRIADRGPRTSDLRPRTSDHSLSHSLSVFQSLTLSVSHCVVDVASCWKPTKFIRCEHYLLQPGSPRGAPHIHSQSAAEEYHRDPARRY